ncbi:MAG TPA: hypothetical protein VK559_08610 [Ferruginibacter sp.]|nr:hypothetical protein [Ferruginibacter sp.]
MTQLPSPKSNIPQDQEKVLVHQIDPTLVLLQMARRAVPQLVRSWILISSFLFLIGNISYSQELSSIEKSHFQHDFENLLTKYGLTNSNYSINVKSTKQSGGQTAFMINNYPQDDPTLLVSEDGVFPKDSTKQNGEYFIQFQSIGAGSTNFNIMCYMLTEDVNGNYDLTKPDFFHNNLKIPLHKAWQVGFGSPDYPLPKEIYFYLKGTYTTLDGTKSYNIDDMYDYGADDNHVSIPLNPERNRILELISAFPSATLISK